MTTTLSAQGLIEIPEVFRTTDSLRPGQHCDIERLSPGEYRVRVDSDDAGGTDELLVDVLLSCPVKGFYAPLEHGQTTNDLKPLPFE